MLEIKKIYKKFDDHIIFEDFSYTFEAGKMYAIVGASGCGKTTLLNMLSGLECPDCGEILYQDAPLSKQMQMYLRKHLGYLFQNYALIEDESVEANLRIALAYRKDKKNHKILMDQALENVGLKNYDTRKCSTLSGGEQQRVALARILLKPCDIVLADEPTGNLDFENRDSVMDILKKMKKEGKCIIVATHDPSVSEICDEVLKLG